MLPPVNAATLERNPRFAQLYQEMVQSRLNADTSTKLIKQQRAAVEVEKALSEHRLMAARQSLLDQALRDVIVESSLPEEVTRSCRIVLAVASGDLSAADAEVLKDDIELFTTSSEIISATVSAQLQVKASTLRAFLGPASDTSSPLSSQTADLLASCTTQAVAISAIRSRIAELASQVQAAHADVLTAAIRILEQTVHGSVARGIRARAEHLAVVARGLELKARVLARSDPWLGQQGGVDGVGEELREAVLGYDALLGERIGELERREGELRTEADGYARAGRGMEQVAERYALLLRQKQELEEELLRLQAGSKR